jgi:hypothetical protein
MDKGRLLAAPVFDFVTGKFRETYEIPLSDIKFIFQYMYDSNVPYWDNESKNSLSLLQVKRGGYWGYLRREWRSMNVTSEPIFVEEIKIYATPDFRKFFNKYIGSGEREMIWEIMKLASKHINKGGDVGDVTTNSSEG